jgi:hypothetical protein
MSKTKKRESSGNGKNLIEKKRKIKDSSDEGEHYAMDHQMDNLEHSEVSSNEEDAMEDEHSSQDEEDNLIQSEDNSTKKMKKIVKTTINRKVHPS